MQAASQWANTKQRAVRGAASNSAASQAALYAAPSAAAPAAASGTPCTDGLTDTRAAAASAGLTSAVAVGHAAAQQRSSSHHQSGRRCHAAPQTAGEAEVPEAREQSFVRKDVWCAETETMATTL